MTSSPELSVVVTVVEGGASLRGCLQALTTQHDAPTLEVLVPYDSTVAGIDALAREFPGVRWIDMGEVATRKPSAGPAGQHELFDRRRAAGLAAATGRLVGMLEDRGIPRSDWAAKAVELHARTPGAVIGGCVDNGIDTSLNWALFFCDFGRYQPPLPAGPSPWVTDVNVVYDREGLERVRATWMPEYHEPDVHAALVEAGYVLHLTPELVVEQRRRDLRLGRVLSERYHWGRLYGYLRARGMPRWRGIVLFALTPLLPFVLVLRLARAQMRKRRTLGRFLRSVHLVFLLVAAWSAGEAVGYVTRAP